MRSQRPRHRSGVRVDARIFSPSWFICHPDISLCSYLSPFSKLFLHFFWLCTDNLSLLIYLNIYRLYVMISGVFLPYLRATIYSHRKAKVLKLQVMIYFIPDCPLVLKKKYCHASCFPARRWFFFDNVLESNLIFVRLSRRLPLIQKNRNFFSEPSEKVRVTNYTCNFLNFLDKNAFFLPSIVSIQFPTRISRVSGILIHKAQITTIPMIGPTMSFFCSKANIDIAQCSDWHDPALAKVIFTA